MGNFNLLYNNGAEVLIKDTELVSVTEVVDVVYLFAVITEFNKYVVAETDEEHIYWYFRETPILEIKKIGIALNNKRGVLL